MAELRQGFVPAALALMLITAAPGLDALAGSGGQDSGRGRDRGTFVWSRNGERIEISHDGEVELTDDDTDVKRLAPGGRFRISTGNWFGRGVDIRADADGRLTRRYRVSIVEKPYDPEGRAWLARMLPRFIRESGIGAPARVARILEAKGPAGVLAAIAQIEGSHGKRVYLAELFRSGALDPHTMRQALAQASREVRSDYDLATLLVDLRQLATDAATRTAYFDAASTIESDYEMRRALSAGLKDGPVEPMVLAHALAAAASIESDYELASLLVQIARLQALDRTTRPAFFDAAEGIRSSYEKGRVLEAVAKRRDASSEAIVAVLRSAAAIESHYERSQVLLTVAANHQIGAVARDAYLAAAERLGEYERGRALSALAKSERGQR